MKVTARICLSYLILTLFSGCASKVLDYQDVKGLEENREYEDLVKVKELPPVKEESPAKPEEPSKLPPKTTIKMQPKSAPKSQPAKPEEAKMKPKPVGPRQPSYEDAENFEGRRPKVDPFRAGERVRMSLSYFNMTAGYMDVMVKPFVEVNGERSYHFEVDIKSSPFFSRIYSVDDKATTYVDYDTLLPFNLDIKVRESKQIREIRSFLDNKNLKGSYWEKKVTKEKGEQEKSLKWDIEPFSQNVISAVYYLRAFTLTPGKRLQFRVADDGKNYMFKGQVLRREKLKTDIGTLDTIVVKPEITLGGAFKPVGDILIWLTDDDRKFVVRIESKIKIGTIVAKVQEIDPGPKP